MVVEVVLVVVVVVVVQDCRSLVVVVGDRRSLIVVVVFQVGSRRRRGRHCRGQCRIESGLGVVGVVVVVCVGGRLDLRVVVVAVIVVCC